MHGIPGLENRRETWGTPGLIVIPRENKAAAKADIDSSVLTASLKRCPDTIPDTLDSWQWNPRSRKSREGHPAIAATVDKLPFDTPGSRACEWDTRPDFLADKSVRPTPESFPPKLGGL